MGCYKRQNNDVMGTRDRRRVIEVDELVIIADNVKVVESEEDNRHDHCENVAGERDNRKRGNRGSRNRFSC